MASINGRANKVKQPKGGYVNPRMFQGVRFEEDTLITDHWNIHRSIVGLAVDKLTRVIIGVDLQKVFKEDIFALKTAKDNKIVDSKEIEGILEIRGVDRLSIINTCKLVAFGIWDKNGASVVTGPRVLTPNEDTISDIKKLVDRTTKMFSKFNCNVTASFGFDGAYTKLIDNGFGGYIANDTILDVKVSLDGLNNKDTLKIIIQYLMCKHSSNHLFKNLTCVGVFNPRLNILYKLKVSELSTSTIREIESDVIGYTINSDINTSTKLNNIKTMENMDVFRYIYNDEVELNDVLKNSKIYSKLKEENKVITKEEPRVRVPDPVMNRHTDIKQDEGRSVIEKVTTSNTHQPKEVTSSIIKDDTEVDLMKTGNQKNHSDFEEAALQGRLSRIISIYRSRDVDKEEFISAYEYATERRNLDVINWMLNIKPNYKHELLMVGIGVSATLGYLEMTKYIVNLDKDMYVRKNAFSLALHLAIVNNNMEVVQYIIRRNGGMCDVLRDDVIYLYKNGFIKEGKCVYNIYKKRNPKDKPLWDIIHGHECVTRIDSNIKRKI